MVLSIHNVFGLFNHVPLIASPLPLPQFVSGVFLPLCYLHIISTSRKYICIETAFFRYTAGYCMFLSCFLNSLNKKNTFECEKQNVFSKLFQVTISLKPMTEKVTKHFCTTFVYFSHFAFKD